MVEVPFILPSSGIQISAHVISKKLKHSSYSPGHSPAKEERSSGKLISFGIFPHSAHIHKQYHNSIATRVLAPASWDHKGDQSLFSSEPPHCHLPITNSQNPESTNQNWPGAVQLLHRSCYKTISCKYQKNGRPWPQI